MFCVFSFLENFTLFETSVISCFCMSTWETDIWVEVMCWVCFQVCLHSERQTKRTDDLHWCQTQSASRVIVELSWVFEDSLQNSMCIYNVLDEAVNLRLTKADSGNQSNGLPGQAHFADNIEVTPVWLPQLRSCVCVRVRVETVCA